MPLFLYEATDREGKNKKGRFEAPTKADVINYLEKNDLLPITIEEKSRAERKAKRLNSKMFEKIRPVDRIILIRNLAATLKAGLSITEALDIMIADAENKIMKDILTQAKSNLENGQPLSYTFSQFPQHFPPVFAGLIKAGESSGHLDKTLDELTAYLTKEYNLVKKIKSALSYPLILLVTSVLIVGFLLIFVLPKLAASFAKSGVQLPALTRGLIALSKAFTYSFLLDFVILAGLTAFFIYFRRTPAGRKTFLLVASKIPVAKDLVKKVALIRFTKTLGSLMSSGMSITESLYLSAEAIGNDFYKKVLLEAVEKIKSGVAINEVLGDYPKLFPNLLVNMVAVGEKTGTMEHVLKTFSEFYDQEVDDSLKDLTTFIEPVMLLAMGIIIGVIAFSILLPIYQLVGNFV
jgi:type II secretory pathway component PulF